MIQWQDNIIYDVKVLHTRVLHISMSPNMGGNSRFVMRELTRPFVMRITSRDPV